MAKKKTIRETPRQEAEAPRREPATGPGASRPRQAPTITGSGVQSAGDECFRFGEASVTVREVDVNTWQCSVEGRVIGFVTYSPEYRFKTDGRGRDYGYRAYSGDTLKQAPGCPATEVNAYSSRRNAARAVVVCHYGGRRYTYVHDNVAILDGTVVPESVYRGRKVIKPLLES